MFNLPKDFDPQQYLSLSFGILQSDGSVHKVRVRFDKTAARYVTEKSWHTSQQLTKQPDGSLLAEFQLSDLRELKAWLLSFAQHAEVLEPESLRSEMKETIQAMQNVYQPAAPKNNARRIRGSPR
jgi:proteasome accessory factor B